MTRDQMIEFVKIICLGGTESEEEDEDIVEALRHAVPHAKISDLIFYDKRNLSPEEIVSEAIKREIDFIEKAGVADLEIEKSPLPS